MLEYSRAGWHAARTMSRIAVLLSSLPSVLCGTQKNYTVLPDTDFLGAPSYCSTQSCTSTLEILALALISSRFNIIPAYTHSSDATTYTGVDSSLFTGAGMLKDGTSTTAPPSAWLGPTAWQPAGTDRSLIFTTTFATSTVRHRDVARSRVRSLQLWLGVLRTSARCPRPPHHRNRRRHRFRRTGKRGRRRAGSSQEPTRPCRHICARRTGTVSWPQQSALEEVVRVRVECSSVVTIRVRAQRQHRVPATHAPRFQTCTILLTYRTARTLAWHLICRTGP